MYACAVNFRCGVIEPGLAHTCPRSTSLRSVPAQQQPDVVARLPLVQELAEHLDARHDLLLRRTDPDDLHFLAHLHDPALHTARHDRPAARDREHVLDRHQEVLVDRPLRNRNVRVHRVHQLHDALGVGRGRVRRLARLQGRALHDRRLVPGESVRRQQLPDLGEWRLLFGPPAGSAQSSGGSGGRGRHERSWFDGSDLGDHRADDGRPESTTLHPHRPDGRRDNGLYASSFALDVGARAGFGPRKKTG